MVYNHNRLLSQYPGAIGVKIGYTDAVGRHLRRLAAADRTLIVTIMG